MPRTLYHFLLIVRLSFCMLREMRWFDVLIICDWWLMTDPGGATYGTLPSYFFSFSDAVFFFSWIFNQYIKAITTYLLQKKKRGLFKFQTSLKNYSKQLNKKNYILKKFDSFIYASNKIFLVSLHIYMYVLKGLNPYSSILKQHIIQVLILTVQVIG